MDLTAKYLSETCSDPIDFLHQLRQTTDPIGGDTEYCEYGELVEYDVAIEAVKKATDAVIKKACEYFAPHISDNSGGYDRARIIENFKKYMEGE